MRIVSSKLFLRQKTRQLFGHVACSLLPFFSFSVFFLNSPSKWIIILDRLFPLALGCVIPSPLEFSMLPDFLWGDNWRVSIKQRLLTHWDDYLQKDEKYHSSRLPLSCCEAMGSLCQSSVFWNDFHYRHVGGCMFKLSKEFIPTENISLIKQLVLDLKVTLLWN